VLSGALEAAAAAVVAGERDPIALLDVVRGLVAGESRIEVEYAEVRAAHDLSRLDVLEGDVLIALGARVGTTRLIDNVSLSIRGRDVTADLGIRTRSDSRSKEWA
jgi:pantothenate synthetase